MHILAFLPHYMSTVRALLQKELCRHWADMQHGERARTCTRVHVWARTRAEYTTHKRGPVATWLTTGVRSCNEPGVGVSFPCIFIIQQPQATWPHLGMQRAGALAPAPAPSGPHLEQTQAGEAMGERPYSNVALQDPASLSPGKPVARLNVIPRTSCVNPVSWPQSLWNTAEWKGISVRAPEYLLQRHIKILWKWISYKPIF